MSEILSLINQDRAKSCTVAKCDFYVKEEETGFLLKHIHGITGDEQVWIFRNGTTIPWERRVDRIYKWLGELHGNSS